MNEVGSLLHMAPGQVATVVGCAAGRGLMSRFAAMGFTPGSQLVMMNNYGHGPILVLIHGARVALGRREAARVMVRREGASDG